MHNAGKVKLGATINSSKSVNNFVADPATFKAGLCVSINSTGGLSLLKSAGMRAGVSLGESLSHNKETVV